MKGRWLPFLATTACLALAATSHAQDRGRRNDGGGSDTKSSSGSKSSGGDARPTRSSGGGDSRPTRPSGPVGGIAGPSRTGGDLRPSRSGSSASPSSTSGGDSRSLGSGGVNGRRNPFERGSSGAIGSTRITEGDHSGLTSSGTVNRPISARPSRSGTVNYGSRSNGFGEARPVRYSGGIGHGELGAQIGRSDAHRNYHFVYGGVYDGLRVGYVGYTNFWLDDYFCYPFYVFNPWMPNTYCVASPWYRYSYLPPYINTSRVVVVNDYVSSWDTGGWSDYNYSDQRVDDRSDRDDRIVTDTLNDIRDAFELNNSRYGDRLLPQAGQVAIFNDGKYDYSLGADDFQDMFLDGIEQSKTVKYVILESQVRGDEIRLRARHEYVDSWGKNQVVFHSYTLRRERDGHYVIREFGTD